MFVLEENKRESMDATQLQGSNHLAAGDSEQDSIGQSICSLMEKTRNGCVDARDDLLQQLRCYMRIVATSKVNKKFQAKFAESDVVQQSIAVAIEKFGDFRGNTEGELFAWVNTILRNEILQQQRALLSDKRDMFREQRIESGSPSRADQYGLVDARHTPKTNVLLQEQVALVNAAILRLPQDYQEIIQLRNQEQLTFAEIGRRMKRTENAVTKLWYRALVQLRRELEIEDV